MYYVDKQLTYRLRKDLIINKSQEIESVFIELFNNNNFSRVIGCIYKQVPVTNFTEDYLLPLFKTLAKEKKETILMEDFNSNILNCNWDRDTAVAYKLGHYHVLPPSVFLGLGVLQLLGSESDEKNWHNS